MPVAAAPEPTAAPSPTPAPAEWTRPAWAPEAVKDQAGLDTFVSELVARDAVEASRKLTLPQKLEDYKLELPKDFKAPEGMTAPAFDDANPLTARFRETALKHGLTQDAASDLLAIYAAGQIDDQATQKKAFDGEVAKLGVTGPQRIDAIKTWLKATGAEALADTLWTAGIVQSYEGLMQKFTGGSSFSQQHRDAADNKPSEDEYSSWSYGEKREYATSGKRPDRQRAA